MATAGAKHENTRGPGKLTLPLNASNRANDPLDREIGDELRLAEENISPFGERPKGGNFSSASPASPAKPFSRPNEENEPPPHRKRLIIQLINGPSGAVSDAMQRELQRGYKGTTKGPKGRVAAGVKNLRKCHFPGILGCHAAPWVVTMVGPKTTSNDPGTHF